MNKTPDGFQEWKGIASSPVAMEGFQEWNGGALQKHEQSPSPISAPSQPRANPPASVDEFVQQITPIAQRIAQKIGAPVDAVIGQLGLETGWGKSVIPGTNNYGNIKDTSGKGVAATDNMNGSRDRYRQYASAEEFADDYAKLVGTNPRYKGAVGAKDAQGFFTGLKQGGYAEDPNYVQSGVAASRTAAESLKKAGFKQESASLPDMTGIPKWSEISTSEKYVKLPDAEKARTKSAYFDELIAPYVAAEGLDVSAEKAKFIGVEKKEDPGLISRASDAAAGVFKAMNPFSATPGLMDGVSQTVRQENTDRFNIPLSAATRAKLDYQYERATPEQRAQLSKADGVVGMYFTERNKQHAERDKLTQSPSELISDPASADIADPRFEARTRQLIRSGMTAEGATTYARTEMQMGMTPGGIKPGSATESDFDFELQDRFKNAPTVIRGAVKGYQGYKQGSLGILQAAADAVGADELSEKFAKGSKDAQGAIDAVGENKNKAGQMFEGAITSIAQQMPSLIGGALTGSEALVLGSMAVQSFGQEYAQGRMQNLNGGDAAKRASLFAAFEVVGEKFGLGNTLKALRMSAAGAPTKDLAMELSKALLKEIPGEVLTTTGQFATDKVGSFGLNKEAGMAEYLSQVGDTIGQTVMQSALMMGGTGGVSTTARHLQNRSNNGARLSEIYANDARDRALSKWESNPLVRPTQSPQVTQSPQAAPQSPQAHPTSQVADAVVRDLAAAAGMDVESLIPTKTLPVQPAAVEPIAAVAEAQGDSGIADQSATPESRELELWLKSSDSGLTPDEQAELSALQNTAPQEQPTNGIEQWPAASPDVATQSNDVQSADVQRSDGDQRRDVGEGQRPDTNAEASLPSVGEDLALRDEGPIVQALNPSINPQQEILSEPTSVEAQQAAPQGIEPQQVQADAAPGIAPWPGPAQPVTQAQTRSISRTVPDDLLGMLNASGGISSSIKSDIDQDAKGRPGLYRAAGRNIDEIGALMVEHGYLTPVEAADGNVVLGMLRRAVGGERIMTAQGIERAQQREDESRHRAGLVAKATELGVNPRGKSIAKLESAIQQEITRREAAFDARQQALILESADAEQAIEDVLALFGSGSPSFQWLADKFAEISARENADHRKSGYDSLVRAARQALRKWHADNARVEAVIEKSLEDGYGSTENPFGPSEGVAGEAEPVAAAEGSRPGGVQSGDGRGQGFILEAPTEQTLAEKVAREQDQTLADKQTADAQRDAFTLDAQTGGFAQNTMQQGGDMFSPPDVSEKSEKVSTSAGPVQKTAETKQVSATEKSNPNQETEASSGAESDQFGGVTEMVNQERAEQGGQSAPARSYVRLQSFDHPSVGVLNNLREQKDAAWAAVKKLKSQVSDGRNDLRVKLIQAESAHKDLVRQESSARESVEEAANTQGLTTYKPSRNESSGPMFSRSDESRPAEKVSQDAKDSLVKMFEGLASSNEAFTYPLSRSAELIQCVSQVTSGLVNAKPMLATHEKSRSGDDPKTSRIMFDGKNKPMQWDLIAKDGSKAYLYQFKDKTLQLDVSGLESGQSMGTAIYQSVGDYAHNAGLIFEGDSAGVNAAAMLRRTENMISSALRWKSTNHLRLADSQKNPEGYMADALNMRGISWSTGDFRHNLAEMLIASYDAVNNLFPEINSIEFVDGKFQDIETWEPVTDEHFKQFAEEAGRRSGIQHQDGTVTRNPLAGSATLKRAALVGTVLRGAGSDAGRRLMAQASAELHARTPESLRKALYSLTSKSQEQIAREIFGNPNPKSTVDQITKELSGEGSLGSNIRVIQSALDLPANERRQVFKSSSADIGLQAVFFPDSGRVYLIADNIEPGEALSALLHDGGVHAGLYGMLGERGINSLAAQIKDWSINSLGKEEGRIAKLALARIPESTSPNHKNEEAVAYFVTEAVKAGHGDPKPTQSTAISRWFAKLWKMVESAIKKLGADPAGLTVDDVVALARGALERVKSGEIDPRRDENEKPLPATITIDGKERQTTNGKDLSSAVTSPVARLNKLMQIAGWEIVYIDLDLTGGTPKADIRINGDDGRFIIAKVDSIGRASFETFQRERSLRMDSSTKGRRPLSPMVDDVFLGRQKFEGARAMLRGMTHYLTDNAKNPVALADMRAAWAGVMAAPLHAESLPAPSNDATGTFDSSKPSILASRSYSPEQDEFRKKAGIGARPTIRQKLSRWAEGMLGSLSWDAFRQGALDQFHGVKLAELATIGALPVEQSAYVTSRLATGASSVMAGLLGHGQARWAANGQHLEKIEGTKGLLDILKPVEGQIDDFLGWMVANRASRLMKEGRENNFTEADIQAGLSLANGKEDLFKQVAKDFADFKRGVLDIAEQAGLIDPSGRKVWDHADWIPFYRQMQDDAVKGPGGKRGLSKQSSGIRQLKGGDSAINDPLENILLNFQHLIDASLKNNALRKVIGNVSGKTNSDEFIESVGYGMQGSMIPRDQIKKQLIAAGTPQQMIDALPAEALFGMAKMWSLKAPEGKDIIRVMENGKPHFYRVTDPLLLKAVTSFEPFNIPGLATMRAFKRLLTRSVTATPAFMVRNFVRDWFSSAIISRDSTNIISAMRGAVKSFSQEGGYEQMMFAGASFAGGQTDGADPEATAKAMRRELRKKGFSAASADEFMASILDRPIKMWDAYSKIGEAIENANREAMFEAAKRSGKSDTAAAFEALDLMDFRLRGSHAAYQMFADIIPFVNARVQGMYRLGRSNPKQVAMRGGLLLLIPSVLLALANAGNDEYEELPDWDKDTYWHFFIGGHHFRLPKPFEVGVMFGTLPERITRAMLGNDSPKKLASRVWFNIAEQFSLVQWPQFVKPAFEVAMNEDGFSKRAIETVGDKAVIPSMRASYYTSDTMKALAGVAPSVSDATGMSPKRMQHLWNGYLGSVGAAALSVSDFAVRRFQGLPFQEAMRRDEYPLLGVFYREAPAKNSGYVEEIYKMAKESSEWKKSYETAMKSGRADYAKQIMADNKEKISMAGGLDHAASQMSGASKKIEAIRKDPALSANEKRDQIDAVIKRRNEIAEKVAKRAIKAWGGSI